MKRKIIRPLILITLIASLAGGVAWWRSPQVASQPTSTPDLQQRVRSAIERASPAVVSIANATGTIISADGLILSQAHVTHEESNKKGERVGERKKGDRVDVFFADGRKTTATLLAQIRDADISLAKIDGDGPFPFLQLKNRTAALGDYVIKLGHPGGYKAHRGLVARLGRVISTVPGHHVTDCLIEGGDSGGPFIDLDGELVGMVHHSVGLWPGHDVPYELSAALESSPLLRFANRSGPKRARVLEKIPMRFTPMAELNPYLRAMQAGNETKKITQEIIPDPIARVGHWFEEPASSLVLPRCDWMDGNRHIHKVIGRIGTRIDGLRQRLVEIVVKDEQRCTGFMIEDGLIVTRASTLPEEFELFTLAGVGKKIEGKLLAVSPSLDLALIRTELTGVGNYSPVAETSPPVGTAVFVPRGKASSAKMGIVAVAERTTTAPIPRKHKVPSLYDERLYDHEFPKYLDTDVHLDQDDSGSPVADMDGGLIGVAVRTSLIGTRVIPAAEVLGWVRSVASPAKP